MEHISLRIIHHLIEKGFITSIHLELIPSSNSVFCKPCAYVKATWKSVLKTHKGEHAKKFGKEVHSDLWGPAPVKSKGRKHYYITYTDDCTCLTHLYLLHAKSDTFHLYKEYKAWYNKQLGILIKILHSDWRSTWTRHLFCIWNRKGQHRSSLSIIPLPIIKLLSTIITPLLNASVPFSMLVVFQNSCGGYSSHCLINELDHNESHWWHDAIWSHIWKEARLTIYIQMGQKDVSTDWGWW